MTDLESLLTEAESTLQELTDSERLGDVDASEAVEDGIDALQDDSTAAGGDDGNDSEGIAGDLESVVTVIDEAEDVLGSIDFSELPDSIDEDEILEAIEAGEIPAALEESEEGEVVKLRQVIRAINIRELLGAADVSELWESKRALTDAVDDLTDDDEDEGLIGEAATKVADAVDDRSDDDELIETDVDEMLDVAGEKAREDFDLESGDLGEYEAIIQQQAIEGVDAFRDGLLKAHGKFEKVVEYNRERTRNIDRSTSSRNPTAVSTIVTDRGDLGSTPNHATIPRQVRHSNAPSRKQIYGRRFELERKQRGYDDE